MVKLGDDVLVTHIPGLGKLVVPVKATITHVENFVNHGCRFSVLCDENEKLPEFIWDDGRGKGNLISHGPWFVGESDFTTYTEYEKQDPVGTTFTPKYRF